jgi:tRNA(Ile2) C34 agmatinyltransferase TiaS
MGLEKPKYAKKPVADDISEWGSCKEILYRCPNCGQSFRMFGDKEHFCHTCGIPIDWNVQKELDAPFYTADPDARKHLIDEINAKNAERKDADYV